jgi:hypothetical protein
MERGTRDNPHREFLRHTADVPIEVRTLPGSDPVYLEAVNVSVGGLSFVSDEELEPGSVIELRIDEVNPPFEARAQVMWTMPEDGRFCVGVKFLDEADAFRVRMVEQVCSIERYRREVHAQEGRELSREDAATEWIGRYAGRFPDS